MYKTPIELWEFAFSTSLANSRANLESLFNRGLDSARDIPTEG